MSSRGKNGHNSFRRKTPVIYVLAVIFLTILFFSNDFGLVDIQKTAIVLAVGIDRENEEFIVSSRIAVPSSSGEQKAAAASIQVETRGDTVGAAIQEINVKTGWYPKLVFLNLIVLGETATEKNTFESLDYFLRNDYMSDDCKICCCEGKAGEKLNTKTTAESIPSLSVGKILSAHSATTGLAAVTTLREFAAGYFGVSNSGYMPVLKVDELSGGASDGSTGNSSDGASDGVSGGSSGEQEGGQSGGGQEATDSGGTSETSQGGSGGESGGKTFSATETALFSNGVYREKLTKDETFAFLCVNGGVRLATFDAEYGGVNYTLMIKKSKPKIKFFVDDFATPRLSVSLEMIAELQDVSSSQTIVEIAAPGKTKQAVLDEAGKKLTRLIKSVFEKSRANGCDLFDAGKRLQKYESAYYNAYRDNILERLLFYADVRFSSAQ